MDIADLLDPDDTPRLAAVPGMGGANVVTLVRARVVAGLPTHVVTLDPCAAQVQEFRKGILRYTVCPRRPRGAIRRFYRQERRYLRQAIQDSETEIVHANWTYEYALAALDAGRPVLITSHDHPWSILRQTGPAYLPNFLWSHYVFRKGRFFSAVSPYNAGYAERWTRRPVSVVPNSVSERLIHEEPSFAPWAGSSPEPYIIASAISDAPFKNARGALRAFAMVRARLSHARYCLMGPGLHIGGREHRWAEAQGLAAGVDFLGPLPHRELLEKFRGSAVLLHPSFEDCCSNAILEALALGKPVIAGKASGGCPWVLGYGDAGLLADVTSPDAMAAALTELHRDWARTREIASRGRALALSRYAPEIVVRQYEEIYRQVIAATPGGNNVESCNDA